MSARPFGAHRGRQVPNAKVVGDELKHRSRAGRIAAGCARSHTSNTFVQLECQRRHIGNL